MKAEAKVRVLELLFSVRGESQERNSIFRFLI